MDAANMPAELPLSATNAVATVTGHLVALATGAIATALMALTVPSPVRIMFLAIIAITVAMYTVLWVVGSAAVVAHSTSPARIMPLAAPATMDAA